MRRYWSGSFTIPPIVPAGQYRVVARCAETDAYGPQPFEVLPGELGSLSVSPTQVTAGTDVCSTFPGRAVEALTRKSTCESNALEGKTPVRQTSP